MTTWCSTRPDLDLDGARIRRELGAHSYASRVREDFESGLRSGVRGNAHVLPGRRSV